MIIVLICIALFVIAAVVAIIGAIISNDDLLTMGGGCALFMLIPCAIVGFWTISVNIPTSVKSERYELQEKLKLYENEKEILASFHTITDGNKTELTSDITLETISTNQYYARVDNYNKNIFNFKTSTMDHKLRRATPWTSWFESSAWDSITEEMLDNLTYTTGK